MKSNKEINDKRAKEIADCLSDPEKRKRLCVSHYFPIDLDRYLFDTEEQYIETRLAQLEKEGCFPFRKTKKR